MSGRADLPPFAKEWMRQWTSAGPALERARAEELRALDASALGRSVSVHGARKDAAEYSGLIDQQAWFMRLRVIDLERRMRSNNGGESN